MINNFKWVFILKQLLTIFKKSDSIILNKQQFENNRKKVKQKNYLRLSESQLGLSRIKFIFKFIFCFKTPQANS
jgi:hypothetical protein